MGCQQATIRSPGSFFKGGSVILHSSVARLHLGWNLQPKGGLAGLGTSPGNTSRPLFLVGSAIGVERTRALV